MKPEQLLQDLGTMVNAPNLIVSMRQIVLNLAVRGKLVPQDPADEPASVLLERIAVVKAQLVKEKKIRKPKPLPPIEADEVPFEVPEGWEWCRLETVFFPVSASGHKVKSKEVFESGQIPVVDQGQRPIAGYTNSVDLAIKPIGACVVFGDHTRAVKYVDFEFVAGADGTKILQPIQISSQYFFQVLTGFDLTARGYGRHYKLLLQQLLPLPPLAEQHRIAAKVDALMGLLDRLEAARDARDGTRTGLRDAALAALADAEGAEAVEASWARIAEHTDDLFTDPADVEPLRQTILQLAVRGRLVPQDTSDEPALVLLERIAAEKAQLVAEKKIRKPKVLPPIDADEVPFEVPEGWELARVIDLATKVTDGEHKTPQRSSSGHYLLSARNVRDGFIDLTKVDYVPSEEFQRIRKRCNPDAGDVLLSCSGSVGRATVVDRDNAYAMVRSAALIKPSRANLSPKYLEYSLRSPVLQVQIVQRSRQSAQANIFIGQISALVVPLPPLAEQHRIVAKVDALIALCDELEDRMKTGENLQSTYMESAKAALI